MNMFKQVLLSVLVGTLLWGCGATDIRDTISMDYQQARENKPLVYPPGVDAPVASSVYKVPDLPKSSQADAADINELVQPPSLLTPEQRGDIGTLNPKDARKQEKALRKEEEKRAKKEAGQQAEAADIE